MCGIVGWVDFGRSLAQEQSTMRAMAATMAQRGPDAEGLWLGEHVAFGHRRLAIIDLPGGGQPMTVGPDGALGRGSLAREGVIRDGSAVAALTYSGEVYNYRELREELQALGHEFATTSDTEVVLRAYLEWGDGFAERLNGMYAFGVWDGRRQRLVLVRDRMGIKPLYYHPTRDGVLFASELKGILAHPEVEAVVDADGLRALLSFVKSPGQGVYRGVHEVRPGHLVIVDRDGVRPRRYWGLHARRHTDDLDTTVRTVRELLEDIVDRQLITDVPLCALLSGGLDSSAITALAAVALRRSGGGPVRSFSVDFVGQAEHFRPDALRPTPDAPYVHEVADHVGAAHTDIVLDTAALTDPLYRTSVLVANDLPNSMGDLYTSLYLLFRAVREHSTVALSGESADEVFGGYAWFHDQRAVNADTFPWVAALRPSAADAPEADTCAVDAAKTRNIVDLLDPDLAAALRIDEHRRAEYHSALAEVEHLPDEDPREHRMREICYLHLTRFVQILLDRKDRMSMAHGLEVRVPFCDHRLVEYVYNTPWSMKTFDGREKSLLRAATADLLPESVVQRRKSPYPSTQDPAYERALRDRLAEILADADAPVAALLNPKRIHEVLHTPVDDTGGFGPARRAVELALGLDQWLRRYPVRLVVGA
ncbi:asparagine synthase (glutamine-hydrolyzing) [Planosporangium thailandense]|uniref:asparagine synthase (glutamine-hydrolyzing) n=1 Tax=Planosporangium thailandense TaxID=765197 RepID=A0ABX0Y5B3_9ACTN|nr:asparagine synthase (glutamine-hydrolyzing) [Planosporangium thailandense]NJC73327.1 asparagine synthase (glutamine-hydrolyzing) [Planosporangium thailandense]